MLVNLVGACTTVAWVHTTGMYANPVNASGQTALCGETGIARHALVYWIGPLLAVGVHERLLAPSLQPAAASATDASTSNRGGHSKQQ